MKPSRGLPEIERPSRTSAAQRLVAADSEQSRLSVDIPVHVHRRLKAHAAEKGVSIRDLLLRLLREAGID